MNIVVPVAACLLLAVALVVILRRKNGQRAQSREHEALRQEEQPRYSARHACGSTCPCRVPLLSADSYQLTQPILD